MEQEITATTGGGATPFSDNSRFRPRDGLWLALAVGLHAIFLLFPLNHTPSATPVSQAVSVTLLAPQKKRPVIEPLDLPVHAPEQLKPPEDLVPPTAIAPDEDVAVLEPETKEIDLVEPLVKTTTALLIDSASRLKWSQSEFDKSRQLGVFVPQGGPENWRPGIVVEDNLFNGMVVPAKTEIVDRWSAADGSHKVVLNTTSGETLCGRAQPWNPMNPLLEPIMTFWKCGGGGSRKFKMPDRYMRSRRDK